jgi:hypothetical protein
MKSYIGAWIANLKLTFGFPWSDLWIKLYEVIRLYCTIFFLLKTFPFTLSIIHLALSKLTIIAFNSV